MFFNPWANFAPSQPAAAQPTMGRQGPTGERSGSAPAFDFSKLDGMNLSVMGGDRSQFNQPSRPLATYRQAMPMMGGLLGGMEPVAPQDPQEIARRSATMGPGAPGTEFVMSQMPSGPTEAFAGAANYKTPVGGGFVDDNFGGSVSPNQAAAIQADRAARRARAQQSMGMSPQEIMGLMRARKPLWWER